MSEDNNLTGEVHYAPIPLDMVRGYGIGRDIVWRPGDPRTIADAVDDYHRGIHHHPHTDDNTGSADAHRPGSATTVWRRGDSTSLDEVLRRHRSH